MADPLQQGATGATGKFGEARLTRFTIRTPELHLDEFVIVQSALRLGNHCGM